MSPRDSARRRRHWTVGLAAVALTVVLGTLATIIASSERQSRSHLEATFKLRGAASATLVGTYLSQQAQREKHTAERFLSAPDLSQRAMEVVSSAFGSHASVALDGSGHVLGLVPYDRRLIGQDILPRYTHLQTAEEGQVAVSNLVRSAARAELVTAIAVPFQTVLFGRRVLSVAYGVDGGELDAFVAHTSTTPGHRVMLVDAAGNVLAASPRVGARTLSATDAPLARAAAARSFGQVPGASEPSMFVSTPVPGTPWRVLIEVPEGQLFASIGGMTQVTPWLIFAFVTLLGILLLALFARSLGDRARLAALSRELEGIACTDPLTGLLNRRGFDEHVTPAFARARRRREPISLLMIDLDRFKEVNDQHGHEAGDRVLRALAACLRDALRAEDIVARLGGDEFVVAMIDTDEQAAHAAAERLLARAVTVDLHDLGLEHGIPMSVGRATGVHVTSEALMREADVELYRVKAAGRNGEAVRLT